MKTCSPTASLASCLISSVVVFSTLAAPPGAANDFASKFKPKLTATPAPAAASQSIEILALAGDPFLVSCLYQHPKRLGSTGGATAAVSVNAQWEKDGVTPWFIEQQRYGVDHIQAGVVLKDAAFVEAGRKVIDWGFARQGSDGDFPGTGDPVHSTSFFIEAAARSALLLRQSKVPAHEAQAKEWTPKILAAARWMVKTDVDAKKRRNSLDPYTHRFFLRAAALGQAAALTGDKTLADAAAAYACEGLSKQLPDGTNPEKGGFDVSYQMVGVNFAMSYFAVCPDPAIRQGLKAMSGKALASALTKVNPDGTVSLEGSTRVGQEESRSGVTKTLDYKNMLQGLIFADRLLGEPRYREAAQRLAEGHGWR